MTEPAGPTTPPQAPPPGSTPPPGGPAYGGPRAGGPAHGAPPPGGPTYGAPAGGPAQPKPPGLWRQATSTTGGLLAVVVAAGLVLLLVVGVLSLGAAVAVRHWAGRAGGSQVEQVGPGQREPGRQGPGRLPMGGGNRGMGGGGGGGPLAGGDPLAGGRLGGALGAVQHGEVTVRDGSGADVVMTIQRGTVSASSASSLSVRSPDGFVGTYAVDSTTRGGSRTPAKGDVVLVVAKKSGGPAVLVRVVRRA